MHRTRVMGVLLVTAVVAGGCSGGPERLGGDALPAGPASSAPMPSPAPASPSAASSSPTPAKTTPSRPPTTSKPASRPPTVLGGDGFGALELGMSRSQAEATGLISGYRVEDFGANCGMAELKGTDATVFFTPGRGVTSIDAPPGVRTTAGIRLGSTMSAVEDAYPGWELEVGGGDTGWGWTGESDDGQPAYRIDVRDGTVSYVVWAAEGQRCVE